MDKAYILMHKNIPVAEITIDGITARISSCISILHSDHLPVGVQIKQGQADRAKLNEWWCGRSIPASRDGIKHLLSELNISSAQILSEKTFGLSLSDQYWICPKGSDLHWEDINFFQNDFSEDVGNILLGNHKESDSLSLISPDNTSDGWLKKKWIVRDGKRCLLKGGSGAIRQEPYNECFASAVMRRLDIPHVDYKLTEVDKYPYSVCEDFITEKTELISAWYIMQTEKRKNNVSVYQHYLNCCKNLGITGIREALDRMIAVDYLIANEDRHQNNFGVVRNAETLEYLGAAPIYDSGSCLWFDMPTAMIGKMPLVCKPFKTKHDEQIKLVSSFDWLDFSSLKGIDEEFRELVRGSMFIDQARCDAICRGISFRLKKLEEYVNSQTRLYSVDTGEDVAEDVAYGGQDDENEFEM